MNLAKDPAKNQTLADILGDLEPLVPAGLVLPDDAAKTRRHLGMLAVTI